MLQDLIPYLIGEDQERIGHLWQSCLRRRFYRGGIGEMKKIAALGEVFYQNPVPHNNAGALGSAATLHAALAIPNVEMIEAIWASGAPRNDVVGPYPKVEAGYALPLQGHPGQARFNPGLTRRTAPCATSDRVIPVRCFTFEAGPRYRAFLFRDRDKFSHSRICRKPR